jgi:hypothetical protein
MRKCISAKSSLTLFCSGVPVIKHLNADENDMSASYSWLSLFFSLCAWNKVSVKCQTKTQ